MPIAGDDVTCVDDTPPTGYSEDACERVTHQNASKNNHVGLHDALGKR